MKCPDGRECLYGGCKSGDCTRDHASSIGRSFLDSPNDLDEASRDEIRASYDNFDEVEQRSKETGVNPKDLLGVSKIPLAVVPWTAVGGMCLALLDGASKYGPFNWRDIPVQSHIYIEAGLGHLMSYADGEDNAQDSGLHHLYHTMACCAIIIDAIQSGRLRDTRYTVGKPGTGSFSRDPLQYLGDKEKIRELLKRPWRNTSIGLIEKEEEEEKKDE